MMAKDITRDTELGREYIVRRELAQDDKKWKAEEAFHVAELERHGVRFD